MRGVSHGQVATSISHVAGDGRGWGASVMLKVVGGGEGVTHVQGDRAKGMSFVYYKNSIPSVSSITGAQFRQCRRLHI